MHPRPPLVQALAIWTAVGLATVWLPWTWPLWQGLGLLIAALALGDLLALHRLPDPRITRRMGRALPLGAWSQVTLEVANASDQRLRISVHDLHPGEFAVRGLPADLDLPPQHQGRIDYRLRPPSRGDFPLTGCAVATRSPLGLWRRTRVLPPAQPLRVFPNFAEISRYTLLAASDQLAQLGVRRFRRLGRGAEFHQLREYREGDSLRQIDWKATSRMHKLIAREYQDERDQRLVFLLDCGRRMRHRDQGRGHLDEALNALLLLAYVAVRQGDAVGLMTYGGPQRWFAPRKEPGTVNRLLKGLYDLQPSLEAADPLVAARALLAAMPRRALVVVLTNSRDEDQEGLAQAAQLLRRRHLVVIADLREAALDRALEAPIATLDDALRFHAVHGWLAERQRHQERLRHLGIQVLDLLPAQLPIALVNRYFEIKRAGAL
ncbi:DUF58 domain-containing protein [uncultured Thiodictyon sp.]|uniref:DUF58 domain-containing protein n=1 Tax=uncultured Thiodictyon sp. TaxID=1846217 RepID=UPI0025D41077|nr:DUF58 domain-containing protein [uncultured Thiodictyon sp.]